MDPLEEFYKIKAEIKQLRGRYQELRSKFLSGETDLRSNRFEVVVKTQNRRTFLRDKLPAQILEDESYWKTSETKIVQIKDLAGKSDVDDIDLIDNDDRF